MKLNNGSIQLMYEWADRGMVQYLHLVDPNNVWNYQLAKVYYQGGEICSSTKGLPDYVNASTVAELIRERKEYLQAKIVQQVVKRLDEATEGEI